MIATARRAPSRPRLELTPRRVALVGCSGPKLTRLAPARELYTSALFRAARAYAELTCDAWAILSAKHGALLPESEVSPYDLRLEQLGPVARASWATWVRQTLFVNYPGATFVLLAGAAYGAPLEGHAQVERPLAGLGVGQRVSWLRGEVAEASRPGARCPRCRGDGLLPGSSTVCPKCRGAAVRL